MALTETHTEISTRAPEDPVDTARAAPVFVDDSGRRRTRVRFLGRLLVAGVALYGALVLVGLTGSVSIPAVHFADVPRLPATTRGVVDRNSRSVALPGTQRGAGTAAASGRSALSPLADARGLASPAVGGGGISVSSSGSVALTGSRSGAASVPTTVASAVVPVTAGAAPASATAPATSPTTVHGQSALTHGNGPPTSVPGKGTPATTPAKSQRP